MCFLSFPISVPVLEQGRGEDIHIGPVDIHQFTVDVDQGGFGQVAGDFGVAGISLEQADGGAVLAGNHNHQLLAEEVGILVDPPVNRHETGAGGAAFHLRGNLEIGDHVHALLGEHQC